MNIHIIFAVKNLFIILVICNADWCEMHRSAMILLDFFYIKVALSTFICNFAPRKH